MNFFHFLRKSDQGNAAIEFAVILPALLLIMLAVIEFGWYFLRADADNRALATASTAIMVSPSSTSQAVANTYGTALVPFGQDGNYICAQAYQQQANAAAYCASGTWNVTTCADTGAPCTTPYYVAVKAFAASKSLTGLASMVSLSATTVTQQNIVTVGAGGGGGGSLPTCTAGQTLVANASGALTCGNIPAGSGSVAGGMSSGGMHFSTCWGVGCSANFSYPVTCPSGYTTFETGSVPDNGYNNSDAGFHYICVHN